ncbi:2OG-Fe(II) oxygenase [Ectopseudomonas mendocina]|uniref:2OG-Fe(II) oxygenase n=1 Tax=Ectopseudomonas mendocina TaxID=300 RepID=A0ABZ2RIE2_ECTME
MNTTSSTCLPRIIDDLVEQGWSVMPQFIPQALTLQLAQECRERAKKGALTPAGVGRGNQQQVLEGVRGDHIQWLEPGQSSVTDEYLQVLDALRSELNQSLYLGLEDFEGHFALYPPGSFYKQHVDRFRDDDRRMVTTVLYLNADWQAEHGGALRLHFAGDKTLDVLPEAGTLVVFMSADLPHEVLLAHRERLSLTGWFRRRGDTPV